MASFKASTSWDINCFTVSGASAPEALSTLLERAKSGPQALGFTASSKGKIYLWVWDEDGRRW